MACYTFRRPHDFRTRYLPVVIVNALAQSIACTPGAPTEQSRTGYITSPHIPSSIPFTPAGINQLAVSVSQLSTMLSHYQFKLPDINGAEQVMMTMTANEEGHDATKVQIYGHDANGDPTWYDVSEC